MFTKHIMATKNQTIFAENTTFDKMRVKTSFQNAVVADKCCFKSNLQISVWYLILELGTLYEGF